METSIYQNPRRPRQMGSVERALSAIGGGTLLGFALGAPGKLRLPLALGGGALLLRGLTGYSLLYRMLNINRASSWLKDGIRVERVVTIQQPVEEVYQFWRNLENLPRFMENVKSVTEQGSTSHWVVEAPLGATVEWDAQLEADQPNRQISWRTLPGAEIENAGTVSFQPAPGGRGTELRVQLEYKAPGGSLGAALAKALGDEPDVQVREDLRRLKMLLEAGQIITVKGQPTGRGRQQAGW